ncbi:MAG: 16S rRNA (guanine(527)-N(7))-methyltransferase RsmG [Chloroflexota bacterium]
MNDTTLATYAAAFNLTLTAGQLAQFDQYQALLLDWNQRLNLTAITDPAAIQVRHFLDSLTCATITGDLNGRRLVDVGTGAGFPGLPLKILFPALQLTLVESVVKKTRFLEAVVNELRLTGVTILAERAEVLGRRPAHRAQYDWVLARSVAELRVLVEYLLPLCRMGGRALAQKGENAAVEVEAATLAIATLGGGRPEITPIHLPGRAETHYLVVIPKERETPERYPRRPGMAEKRPL